MAQHTSPLTMKTISISVVARSAPYGDTFSMRREPLTGRHPHRVFRNGIESFLREVNDAIGTEEVVGR